MAECFDTCGVLKKFGHKHMPRPLPIGAAAGGVTAAFISSLLKDPVVVPSAPYLYQESQTLEERIHWPSLCLGILLGIFIGQLLELLLLFRQYLAARVRFQVGAFGNYLAVKNRIGG